MKRLYDTDNLRSVISAANDLVTGINVSTRPEHLLTVMEMDEPAEAIEAWRKHVNFCIDRIKAAIVEAKPIQ